MNPDTYIPRCVFRLLALNPENWPEPEEDDLPSPRDVGVPARSWDQLYNEE